MAAVIPQGQSVTLFASKRKLTLKPSDLILPRRARPPRRQAARGLQRVDRIEIEPVASAEPAAGGKSGRVINREGREKRPLINGDGIHLTVAPQREWSYGFKPDNKTVPPTVLSGVTV